MLGNKPGPESSARGIWIPCGRRPGVHTVTAKPAQLAASAYSHRHRNAPDKIRQTLDSGRLDGSATAVIVGPNPIEPMQDEHHDLIHDFPEYRERIHTLKTADHHFRRLFDEYHHVDREVRRAEYDVEPKCDETVNELKLRRLTLKDNLLSILKAA